MTTHQEDRATRRVRGCVGVCIRETPVGWPNIINGGRTDEDFHANQAERPCSATRPFKSKVLLELLPSTQLHHMSGMDSCKTTGATKPRLKRFFGPSKLPS